jgi:hypothetical protein
MAPAFEKVKIRGLAVVSACVLGAWGAVVALKGLYDLFAGEPDANLYSAYKWQFVTEEQWLRYGGFELAYGLACFGLALMVWRYSRFLPFVVERRRPEPPVELFD